VSPILGIIASQNYVRIPPNSYESIATITVGAGGSVGAEFTSIPSTYTHLQIRYIGASQRNTYTDDMGITVNGITSSTYAWHSLYANNTTVAAEALASTGYIQGFGVAIGSNSNAGTYGAGIIDILDYANTNKNKTLRALAGLITNSGDGAGEFGRIHFSSGLVQTTSAITSIKLESLANNTWRQYSQFALYGIKGA
jgi:hypothetical protein